MSQTVPSPDAALVRTIQKRLSRLAWLANGVGALVVFIAIGFLIPVFIDPDKSTDLALFNVPVVVACYLGFGAAISRISSRHIERALAWVVEGRAPSRAETSHTLALAFHAAKSTAIGWATVGIVGVTLNGFTQSWEFAAIVGAAIWLGAETTCALIYLAAERIVRPATALALAAAPRAEAMVPGVRIRLAFAWLLGTGVPLLGLLVVAAVGLLKPGVNGDYVAAAVLFLGVVASAVGFLATVFAARAIADPLTSVRAGLDQIEGGELDVQVPVDDASEVGQLQAGFNRMAEGLRERERIRDMFGRQVGEDVAKAALREGTRLGGEERTVGALFVDIVGFTSMALAMPPTEVVRVLNRFFRVVVEVVEAEGGFVNKFAGDAAMCVFGAPIPRDDPAGDALRAARSMAHRLGREVREIDFGIGVSAGVAVAGNVGAERRFEYTVVGDPVNEAARLAELAKERPERVLAAAPALGDADGDEGERWSVTESALLRGRSAPTGVAHPGPPGGH